MQEPIQNDEKRWTDPITGKFYVGNPGGGRPKGSLSVVEEIKKQLQEIAEDDPEKKQKLVLLVRKVLTKAINDGDTSMIKDIIDRVDGKPTQPIDLGTDNRVWEKLAEIEKNLKNE